MIRIEINAPDAKSARDEVVRLLGFYSYAGDMPGVPVVGPAEEIAKAEEVVTATGEEKRRRGRPRKSEASADLAEDDTAFEPVAEVGEPEAETIPSSATLDDVRSALQRVAASQGIEAARALLAEFGAAKASEVKPEHYGAFVARVG